MAPIAIKMESKLLTSRASSLYSPSAPLHLQTLHSRWDPETSSHLTKGMHCLCHALYAVRLPCNAGIQLTAQLCLQSPLEWEWLTLPHSWLSHQASSANSEERPRNLCLTGLAQALSRHPAIHPAPSLAQRAQTRGRQGLTQMADGAETCTRMDACTMHWEYDSTEEPQAFNLPSVEWRRLAHASWGRESLNRVL